MEVTLYKWRGYDNTINKAGSSYLGSPAFSGDVMPYGQFDSNNVSFRLDTMYDVNYCKYRYNGKYYYGYVTVSVDSDGLYVYDVTVDSLETCYQGGCMNVGNICSYSSLGTAKIKDDRVSYNVGYKTEKCGTIVPIFQTTTDENYIVMVVLAGKSNTWSKTSQNPAFNVYLMRNAVYNVFLDKFRALPDATQNQYGGCIMKIYSLFSRDAQVIIRTVNSKNVSEIQLCTVNNSDTTHSGGTSDITVHLDEGGVTLSAYNLSQIDLSHLADPEFGCPSYYTFEESNISGQSGIRAFDINTPQWQYSSGVLYLSIPDSGTLAVSPADVWEAAQRIKSLHPESTPTLNILKSWDFAGGQVKTVPFVSDVISNVEDKTRPWANKYFSVLNEYAITSSIPQTCPFMYDTSVMNWGAVQAQIDVMNARNAQIGIRALEQASAGNAGAGLSSLMDIAINERQIEAVAQSSSFQANYGAATVSGGAGGSVDRADIFKGFCFFKYQDTSNLQAIQSSYGKPDGQSRNLQTVGGGYYQTMSCHLLQNGFPQHIVNRAEALLNAGVYKH